jgi:hypothetical protein
MLSPKVFKSRSPQKSHGSIMVFSLGFIFSIETTEEHSIEAHLCIEPGIGVGMSESINIPADTWHKPEFIFKKLMADHHVVDHVFILWSSFVMGCPSTIDNLKLFILNQFFNTLLFGITLGIVPS